MGETFGRVVKERFGACANLNFSCLILHSEIACPIPNQEANTTTPVSNLLRIPRRSWLIVPLLALAFAVATTAIRVRRIEFVSRISGEQASPSSGGVQAPEAGSEWQPQLIIPGEHNESFERLDQVRQMFDRRQWRVRFVDYENAQLGHEVFASCPYRWWLGLAAWCHHKATGAAIGPSIEWAALYADPILLVVFGAGTLAFVARRYGVLAAALGAAALATLFPLAAEFVPGVPDDHGLAVVCAVWSVLALLAGLASTYSADSGRHARRWFTAGGVAGGIGLWVNVSRQLPVLLGIALGALLAAWIARSAARAESPGPPRAQLWRTWAMAGSATCLAAYLLEYFPSYMGGWEFRSIHPIFGVAWVGGGELVARLTAWIEGCGGRRSVRGAWAWVLAAAAVATLPAAMWIGHNLGLLSVEVPSMQLSRLPVTVSAPSFWAWLLQNGFTATVGATIAPLLILFASIALLFQRTASPAFRCPIALALGPVLFALALAYRQISRWSDVDAGLFVLLIVCAGALGGIHNPFSSKMLKLAVSSAVLVAGTLGTIQLWPSTEANRNQGLSRTEAVGLIERDLAYWLAKHVGPAGGVALAPPNVTTTLYYYGGVRGLSTFGWENRDGLQAGIRITSASTPEEAQDLIGLHGVTHIVIPTWDPFMDALAVMGAGQLDGSFLDRLHHWNLPGWLKPVQYIAPNIGGFEGQAVVVLEVVEEQDDAVALSRIAVYLADMGQVGPATRAGRALRRFPADLGALVARAQVEKACGEDEEFAESMDLLLRRISGGADRDLPWDQRVGLAVLLAQAHHMDLVLPRLRQCIAEIDDGKLRSLSTLLLYRFHVLRRAFSLEIRDPAMRALSLDLLPPDLRSRVER
jgi:hypothetical protein